MSHYKWKLIVVACILSGLLVGIASAADNRQSIGVANANIRMGAGKDYEVKWQFERYYPVVVLEEQGKWRKVKDFEGDEGWVHSSLLANTKTIVIKKEKCNVRSGPGKDNRIEFVADKGVPFRVIKKEGNWISVRHADGDGGWVYQSLVW